MQTDRHEPTVIRKKPKIPFGTGHIEGVTAKKEKPIELFSTKNYKAFHYFEANREIDESDVSKLRGSMRQNGFIRTRFVECYHEDGILFIVDGQHRFEAAKREGLPIFYVILDIKSKEEALKFIKITNTNQKRWAIADFLHYYAKMGVKDYVELEAFRLKHDLPITIACSILRNTAGHDHASFKEGKFVIADKKRDLIDSTITKINDIRNLSKTYESFKSSRSFVKAVYTMVTHMKYDHERMLETLSNNRRRLVRCGTEVEYLDCLGEIYNLRLRKKSRLNFNATS